MIGEAVICEAMVGARRARVIAGDSRISRAHSEYRQLVRGVLAGAMIAVMMGLAVSAAKAAPASDPASLVDGLVSQAVTTLTNERLGDAQREQEFRALLQADFDIPRISRFVLGRYWNSATGEERETFARLFERWIVRIYAGRFKQYSGETVKVTGSRDESAGSSIVSTAILQGNGAPAVRVDWRVRRDADDFKIVDVNVEGVSLALTQREEFATVVGRNGGTVSALNKALEDRLATAEMAVRQGD